MKFAVYTNCVSAHQVPLAREIVARVGAENFRYVSADEVAQKYQTLEAKASWITTDVSCLDTVETLYAGGLRPFDLFERRASAGLKTLYYSERWFKPWHGLPGWMRMLVPSYRKMAKRFVKWANEDQGARVLAVGPWAKRDFLKMGVKEEKVVDWGYYVAPSTEQRVINDKRKVISNGTLKVLWVGREGVAWKRVKDIERAVVLANKKLKSSVNLNLQPQPISFTKLTGVTPAEVRAAMRSHDLYVLASDACEGWGAALNEALEEGMRAIGTFEAGASAAMLPHARLYHGGDVGALAKLLEAEYRGELPPCSIGDWTAETAAERLTAL